MPVLLSQEGMMVGGEDISLAMYSRWCVVAGVYDEVRQVRI